MREDDLTEESADGSAGEERGAGRRRALCIGIDTYPTAPLHGCVADAKAWQQTLKQLGFETRIMLNEEAKWAKILDALTDLVKKSRSGDVVVLQYSGHGTTVPDASGDEVAGNNLREDEALCPHDFASGKLVIDDDVARIFRGLAAGVNLTCFFDCCHSGSISRVAIGVTPTNPLGGGPDERPRFVRADDKLIAAHRRFREKQGGTRATSLRGPDSMKEVVFSACLDSEVAWESNGQGDFTRVALPMLKQNLKGVTNEAFAQAVTKAFGATPRQHPELDCAPTARRRPFLQPLAVKAVDAPPGEDVAAAGLPGLGSFGGTGDGSGVSDREAIAQILTGLAALLSPRR